MKKNFKRFFGLLIAGLIACMGFMFIAQDSPSEEIQIESEEEITGDKIQEQENVRPEKVVGD